MVAYVILISITIALSVLVYNWLRFYVTEEEVPSCSDNVKLIIKNYECIGGSELRVTLENKGLFTVDGFTMRVHNRTDAEFGFYTLNKTGQKIPPGEELITIGDLNGPAGTFPDLTIVEIQPFVIEKDKISCRSTTTQKISCS